MPIRNLSFMRSEKDPLDDHAAGDVENQFPHVQTHPETISRYGTFRAVWSSTLRAKSRAMKWMDNGLRQSPLCYRRAIHFRSPVTAARAMVWPATAFQGANGLSTPSSGA